MDLYIIQAKIYMLYKAIIYYFTFNLKKPYQNF